MDEKRLGDILIGAMRLAKGGDAAVYEPCPVCSSDCGVFSSGPKRTSSGGCTTCDRHEAERIERGVA